MGKYLLQKFLPNCNTDDINLENFTCNDKNNVQRISISELDEKIDTEENLISYLSLFSKKIQLYYYMIVQIMIIIFYKSMLKKL